MRVVIEGYFDLLAEICDNPGWQPTAEQEEIARDMVEGGWIIARLDGYEATPEALECYPHFWQEDRMPPIEPVRSDEVVPFDHVVALLYALLTVVPFMHLAALCEERKPVGAAGLRWDVARGLAETMR